MITKDVLGIYWNSHLGEVDGQTFYLFYKDNNPKLPNFPTSLWPEHTEVKKQKLFGDKWVVWLWDVKFSKHPEKWKEITKDTLSYFIENGAEVSWCGLDGYFSDPPGLFDPDEMSGGVYAALTPDNNFICHTDLYVEYQSLSDDELIHLKKLVEV
ncbi:hypothetical protein L7G72_19115 [Xenorhabdus bovienii]|uniref:hypothetical protein n=1 Tax=Xenorhabdus bovienii TaxID=40576 RepID=UPI001EDDA373|nr:hypothetical protein [Xenorhabdus bovienii]MCG3463880.1 hypothetical protein [Xenorhabdus bovienii]